MNQQDHTITKEEILDFLNNQRLATVATVKESGLPDAASVYYVVNEDGDLFFLTRKETGKFKNIQQSGEVVVVVTDREKLETVKIQGKAVPMIGDFSIIEKVVTRLATARSGFSAEAGEFIADLDKLLPLLKRHEEGGIVAIRVVPYKVRISRYATESLEEEIFYCEDFIV